MLGPTAIDRLLGKHTTPWVHHAVTLVYWPIAAMVSLVALATLYHLSVPHRRRWRSALPGAVFALVIWCLGSWGLRSYIHFVFARTIAYGALAAPVAVLLFLYITALAVLLGAELNATLDLTREELERADQERAAALEAIAAEGRRTGRRPAREDRPTEDDRPVRFEKRGGSAAPG